MNITYTFAVDCPVKEVAGKTFTRGTLTKKDGKDVVDFGVHDGRRLIAAVSGKPELEAILAATVAQAAQQKANLTAIGWDQYEPVLRAYSNAAGAYERASQHGFPIRESRIMGAAEVKLSAAREQYPNAAAYALALRFCDASNDAKAAAGRRAVKAIESGASAIEAIEIMQTEWSAAAAKAVNNA